MSDHPFKEYHDDAKIGNLLWRIDRRSEMLSESQDGAQIDELMRKLKNDRAELTTLKADYEQRTIK